MYVLFSFRSYDSIALPQINCYGLAIHLILLGKRMEIFQLFDQRPEKLLNYIISILAMLTNIKNTKFASRDETN